MDLSLSTQQCKKQKTKTTVPHPPNGWDRCHAYMERKSRFCRQQYLPSLAADFGYFYCGNHVHLVPGEALKLNEQKDGVTKTAPLATEVSNDTVPTTMTTTTQRMQRKSRRIPCPIDPTHSILADSVEQHIAKCPKTIAQQKQAAALYYCHDCNSGGYDTRLLTRAHVPRSTPHDEAWAQRVALRVLHVHQSIFDHSTTARTDPATRPTADSTTRHTVYEALVEHDLSGPELEAGLVAAVTKYRIKSGGERHLRQQASLIGHLRRIHILSDVDTAIVGDSLVQPRNDRLILELGAGRGMTGLLVAGVAAATKDASTRLVMVERGASRSRAEKCLRKAKHVESSATISSDSNHYSFALSKVQWSRISCDLAHVDMKVALTPGTDSSEPKPHSGAEGTKEPCKDIVVIAKHLCGAGTDLALKSLEPIREKVTACIMATCCHGVCSWKDYVGRDYLTNLMVTNEDHTHTAASVPSFGASEFELLRQWSSGTVKDVATDTLNGSADTQGLPDGAGKDEEDDDGDDDNHGNNMTSSIQQTDAVTSVANMVESLNLKCGVQGLGRASQRLIDYGRKEYLRRVIFEGAATCHSELIHYVPESVTPQNAALIAYRS